MVQAGLFLIPILDWVKKSRSHSPSPATLTTRIMTERPPNIQTERLILLALVPEEMEALIRGDVERFTKMTGFAFPPENANLGADLSWHLKAIRTDSRQLPWRIRAIVESSSNIIVGSINLKGPPSEHGDVEIGWGLIEGARQRGYATEAAAAVINWVVRQPGVTSISATVPDENQPSRRLATRLGLIRTSERRRNLPLWKRDLR